MNWAEHVFSGGFGWLDAYAGGGFKFQPFVYFYPYLGRWSNLTMICFKWVGSTNNLEILLNDFACLILSVLIFNLSRHFSPVWHVVVSSQHAIVCVRVRQWRCLLVETKQRRRTWEPLFLAFPFSLGVFPKGWADLFGTKVIVVWMEAWNSEQCYWKPEIYLKAPILI